MSIFSNLFGGSHHTNPYKAAVPYLEQVPGALTQYYDPYVQLGQQGQQLQPELADDYRGLLSGFQAGLDPQLSQQYSSMAMDPNAYYSSLASGFQGTPFQEDPGYQWNLDQQLQAQNQAMAAGGMTGSPQHQQLASQLASNIANQQYGNWQNRQDQLFRDYIGNQLGIAGAGLSGLQSQQQTGIGRGMQLGQLGLQGLANLASQDLGYGYGASTGLGQRMADYWGQRAGLASGQAQDLRQRQQGILGGALGLGSKLIGSFL